MLVQVENGRATRLRGDPNHPVTRGFLCGKVTQYLEREYSPDRCCIPKSASAPKVKAGSSGFPGTMPSPQLQRS